MNKTGFLVAKFTLLFYFFVPLLNFISLYHTFVLFYCNFFCSNFIQLCVFAPLLVKVSII